MSLHFNHSPISLPTPDGDEVVNHAELRDRLAKTDKYIQRHIRCGVNRGNDRFYLLSNVARALTAPGDYDPNEGDTCDDTNPASTSSDDQTDITGT